MLLNKESITLDSADNVLVGPNEYFQVVIDEFDGEMVQAWHVEDSAGNATENLAQAEGSAHIDLLMGNGNRTVSHFLGRYWTRFYDQVEELQAQIAELEAQLEEQ